MVVHHVEMDDVSTRSENVVDFLAKLGKVGGKDAGGDAEVSSHGEPRKKDRLIVAVPIISAIHKF
jgi:hypothetical protein